MLVNKSNSEDWRLMQINNARNSIENNGLCYLFNIINVFGRCDAIHAPFSQYEIVPENNAENHILRFLDEKYYVLSIARLYSYDADNHLLEYLYNSIENYGTLILGIRKENSNFGHRVTVCFYDDKYYLCDSNENSLLIFNSIQEFLMHILKINVTIIDISVILDFNDDKNTSRFVPDFIVPRS